MFLIKSTARRRIITYFSLFILLLISYFLLRDSTWQGSKQLHTLMETAATILALLVGVISLIRFYTKKESIFLFVGTGFLGTSLLDAYHTIVTSTFFDMFFPSPPSHLIPWSWIASRLFLSIALLLSWINWYWEDKNKIISKNKELSIYGLSGLLVLASFLLQKTYLNVCI